MKIRNYYYPQKTLGELCHIQIGKTPSRSNSYFWGDGEPWISISDMNGSKYVSDTKEQITSKAISECNCKRLPKETLLLSFKLSIGKVAFTQSEMFTNEAIAALLIKNKCEIYDQYLYWALQAIDLTENTDRAVKGKTLNKSKLKNIKIPLPPLNEQKRIAAILDKADEIRRKRKEAIRLTDELLRSVFLDMFGDPVTNPKGWEVRKLGDILYNIESGWSPKCEMREADKQEWGILKLGSVTYGHFNQNENKAMLPTDQPKKELEVKPGDLLFARKNTYELVGASAFVWKTRSKLMLPDLIFRLCLKDALDPVYTWQALSRKTMRFSLSRLAGGTAGSMPNISKARLCTLPIPVPPKELQQQYRKIAYCFWDTQNHQKESFNESNTLFNSLMQRAFKGEL